MTTIEPKQLIGRFPYDAFKSARELLTKETSKNCAIAAFQKVAYIAGAVGVAVAQVFLDFCRAIANAVIYLANGVHSYFADKEVVQDIEEQGSGTTEGQSSQPLHNEPTKATPPVIVDPVIVDPVIVEPISTITPVAIPPLKTTKEKVRDCFSSAGQGIKSFVVKTVKFSFNVVSTVTYPVIHPKWFGGKVADFAQNSAWPKLRHPLKTASGFIDYVSETEAWGALRHPINTYYGTPSATKAKPAEVVETVKVDPAQETA